MKYAIGCRVNGVLAKLAYYCTTEKSLFGGKQLVQ